MPPFGFSNPAQFREQSGYEIEGIWYPRVTSIVSIKAKPSLLYYYAEQPSFREAQQKTALAAEEGTLIHDTVEALLKGEAEEIPTDVRPVIEAFETFRAEHELVPLMIEERVKSSEHRYAGTLDLLARVDGVLGVVDIKTSVAVYRDYNIQTSAYVVALQEAGFGDLERWILRLDQRRTCVLCKAKLRVKGGNRKVKGAKAGCSHQWGPLVGEVEFKKLGGIAEDFRAFMACKHLWEWEHQKLLEKIHYYAQ